MEAALPKNYTSHSWDRTLVGYRKGLRRCLSNHRVEVRFQSTKSERCSSNPLQEAIIDIEAKMQDIENVLVKKI